MKTACLHVLLRCIQYWVPSRRRSFYFILLLFFFNALADEIRTHFCLPRPLNRIIKQENHKNQTKGTKTKSRYWYRKDVSWYSQTFFWNSPCLSNTWRTTDLMTEELYRECKRGQAPQRKDPLPYQFYVTLKNSPCIKFTGLTKWAVAK